MHGLLEMQSIVGEDLRDELLSHNQDT
jgi:hypothetical protein